MLAVSVLSPSSPPCDGIVHIYLAQCLDKSRQWHGPSFWLSAIAIWGAAATPFNMVGFVRSAEPGHLLGPGAKIASFKDHPAQRPAGLPMCVYTYLGLKTSIRVIAPESEVSVTVQIAEVCIRAPGPESGVCAYVQKPQRCVYTYLCPNTKVCVQMQIAMLPPAQTK